jgi:hypothetical protein
MDDVLRAHGCDYIPWGVKVDTTTTAWVAELEGVMSSPFNPGYSSTCTSLEIPVPAKMSAVASSVSGLESGSGGACSAAANVEQKYTSGGGLPALNGNGGGDGVTDIANSIGEDKSGTSEGSVINSVHNEGEVISGGDGMGKQDEERLYNLHWLIIKPAK